MRTSGGATDGVGYADVTDGDGACRDGGGTGDERGCEADGVDTACIAAGDLER